MNRSQSPGILAADQAFERQGHPLDVDVLPVVAHRAAHVHQHAGGALGRVARAMDLDVVLTEADRQCRGRSRTSALMNVPGMSMLAIESPNSYCLVVCISTAPSPTIGALMPAGPRRGQLAETTARAACPETAGRPCGVSRKLPDRLFEPLPLGHLAQVVLNLLLQGAELFDVARLGELVQAGPCR